jgi:HEAT repeat protein
VHALAGRLTGDDVRTILSQCLRSRSLETARECVSWLARHDEPASAVPTLTRVLAVERGALAAAAARALADSGGPATEGALLDALGRDDADVRVAAAFALGRVGSARAVPSLKDAEKNHEDDSTRRAAREAVASIQERLGASAGQLSLAAADAGMLSLAEDETGRLSLGRDEKP